MSKKKNTLRDLDEFLKQQAASLVTPEKLEHNNPDTSTPEPVPATGSAPISRQLNSGSIVHDLLQLAAQQPHEFRKTFYDVIVKTAEALPGDEPGDTMLINTALYLKHGGEWKEAIKNYWAQAK